MYALTLAFPNKKKLRVLFLTLQKSLAYHRIYCWRQPVALEQLRLFSRLYVDTGLPIQSELLSKKELIAHPSEVITLSYGVYMNMSIKTEV